MIGLLRGMVLVAALTPLCWLGVLMASKQMRRTGLIGPGLGELLDQLERNAWAVGGFLALLVVNVMGESGLTALWVLVLIALVAVVCWVGLWMLALRRRHRR
jgi:hypothetical protein